MADYTYPIPTLLRSSSSSSSSNFIPSRSFSLTSSSVDFSVCPTPHPGSPRSSVQHDANHSDNIAERVNGSDGMEMIVSETRDARAGPLVVTIRPDNAGSAAVNGAEPVGGKAKELIGLMEKMRMVEGPTDVLPESGGKRRNKVQKVFDEHRDPLSSEPLISPNVFCRYIIASPFSLSLHSTIRESTPYSRCHSSHFTKITLRTDYEDPDLISHHHIEWVFLTFDGWVFLTTPPEECNISDLFPGNRATLVYYEADIEVLWKVPRRLKNSRHSFFGDVETAMEILMDILTGLPLVPWTVKECEPAFLNLINTLSPVPKYIQITPFTPVDDITSCPLTSIQLDHNTFDNIEPGAWYSIEKLRLIIEFTPLQDLAEAKMKTGSRGMNEENLDFTGEYMMKAEDLGHARGRRGKYAIGMGVVEVMAVVRG